MRIVSTRALLLLLTILGEKIQPGLTSKQKSIRRNLIQEDQIGLNVMNYGKPLGYIYKLTDSSNNKEKPRIHTFFGYYGHVDYRYLEIWKEAWYEAGFFPVVLTMEQAEKHSLFREFQVAFEQAKHPLSDYDRMCFYRWLAMAVNGGGFMSDLDVLPLHMTTEMGYNLPHNGNFTAWVQHVPCLLSGSSSEWNRMSNALLQAYKSNYQEEWTSDMLALLYIQKVNPNSMVIKRDLVLELEHVYIKQRLGTVHPSEDPLVSKPFEFNERQCELLQGRLAMHFSHGTTFYLHFDRWDSLDWVHAYQHLCK